MKEKASFTGTERFKSWFDGLEPKRKRSVVVAGAVSAALLLVVAISYVTPDKRSEPASTGNQKTRAAPNLLQSPTQGMGLDSVSGDVLEVQGELASLRQEMERLRNQPPEVVQMTTDQQPADPDAALQSMRDQITGSSSYQGAPPGTSLNPQRPSSGSQARTTQPRSGPAAPSQPVEQPNAPTMQVVRGKAREIAPPPPPPIARDVYIPTASIMTGVLLNGLDAPTGRTAQSQPVPVVVRLKHEAILPSRYRSDVREAFVLAAGFGDLSSERAYLRAERLSMILRDGSVIDIPIKMAAVGSDGKTGIRGNVVSKQGALIAKALMAGTAEGVSRAFGGNSYGSFGRSNELPDSRDMIVGGIGGGTSSALDRVANYFLQQADAMYPVVEIGAGMEVSFIVLEGTDLTPRDHPQDAAVSPEMTASAP